MLTEDIDIIFSQIKAAEFKGNNGINLERLYQLMDEKDMKRRQLINYSPGTEDNCCVKCKNSVKNIGIMITCKRFAMSAPKDYKCDYYDSPKELK